MRKNNNKKGFTIVELVIVIAVIGILAAVMIPTFASIINDANENAALQKATNAYKEAYAEAIADGKIENNDLGGDAGEAYIVGDYKFTFSGTLDNLTCTVAEEANSDAAKDGYYITVTNGAVKVNKETAANKATTFTATETPDAE